uniref:Mitochondrial fission 1 protein n=1 Tax=Neobodo designis TaxID=312471 RepID=A0A7S1QIZ8_NEODS
MASDPLDAIFSPHPEALAALESSIVELKRAEERGDRLKDHAFQLATALISHVKRPYVAEGVELLENLSFQYWRAAKGEQEAPDGAVSRESGTSRLAESCFYLAVGHAKLGDTVKARSAVEKMLAVSPNHPQGIALRDRLESELFDSGVKGLLGLTTAVAGAAVIYGFLRGRR